ncbi:U3-agatoxin-Ao1j-like [Lineus longissimus]|uniref:U3-agatoxin-Ao1j-like n=1 Tax=Lineus longissimus TaxID=88925 RepID=UPI00315D2929
MKYLGLILVLALVIGIITAKAADEDFIIQLQKRGCVHRNQDCSKSRNNCCHGMFCQHQFKSTYKCKDNGTPPVKVKGLSAVKG